jgi:hypothetical protein
MRATRRWPRPTTPATCACVCLCVLAAPARAETWDLLDFSAPGYWRALVGPYTQHLNEKPEFEYVWAVAIERQRDDGWLYGASYFSNSFGQGCGYLYLGQQIPDLFDQPKLYFQWTAGLLYGYKPPYENRVPFNVNGFSPGVVLSLGWQFDKQFAAQLNKVGTSGVMLQLSYAWR